MFELYWRKICVIDAWGQRKWRGWKIPRQWSSAEDMLDEKVTGKRVMNPPYCQPRCCGMSFDLQCWRRLEWCLLGTLEEKGFPRDTYPDGDVSRYRRRRTSPWCFLVEFDLRPVVKILFTGVLLEVTFYVQLEISNLHLQWVVAIGVRDVIMSKSIDISSIFRAVAREKAILL